MDGAGEAQPLVVLVHQVFGAVLGAEPAGRALVRVDIAWSDLDPGDKLPRLSFQGEKIGVA
jgi:hypothetical protein